jgi:hypothetical protein
LQSRQTQVNQREPLQGLTYCDSSQITPCIVSFSQDSEGSMLVNILIEGPVFPDFYLKIIHSKGESIYQCREVEGFSTSVYCTGKALPPGEEFQFYILSIDDNHLLAQGNFSIIGMALSTVEVFSTPAEGTPFLPTSSGLTAVSTVTPTPGRGTPTRTPTRTPSYPNPTAYP